MKTLVAGIVLAQLATTTDFYGPWGEYRGRAQTYGGSTDYYDSWGQYRGRSQTFTLEPRIRRLEPEPFPLLRRYGR